VVNLSFTTSFFILRFLLLVIQITAGFAYAEHLKFLFKLYLHIHAETNNTSKYQNNIWQDVASVHFLEMNYS